VSGVALRIVRLGSPRAAREGLRVGTVRRPPRGVPKAEYAERDLFDVWFPNLSPTEELLKRYYPVTDAAAWRGFARAFRKELKSPAARHDLDLIAALSHVTNLSIGCYCEDASRCHRSILRELLEQREAEIVSFD
jgi:uncharacterized protein YeaO (DUF488 family)